MKTPQQQSDFNSRLDLYKSEINKQKSFSSKYYGISEQVVFWKPKINLLDKILIAVLKKRKISVALIYKDLKE